jgi:hypothetical protein
MSKVIVTTTIYPPSEASKRFANIDGWKFVVVGDLKTPGELYKDINCIYLTPAEQEERYPELSKAIGWNKITRRNIGFVYAYHELKADIVATVDDDNIPYDSWGKDLYIGKPTVCDYYETDLMVADPLSVTNNSQLWHRGYPIELLKDRHNIEYKGKKTITPLVQADLWDGDPDIDAMARLTQGKMVKFDTTEPYCFNKITPFNSQNTFIARVALPFYAVFPYVGRMDDIWGSYILQKVFPNKVIFNKATVYQERNKQDLIRNLEHEIIGYRNTYKFIKENQNLTLPFITEEVRTFYRTYLDQF